MTVETEATKPDSINYKRGNVEIVLTDFHATLYRWMVGMYGEQDATEKFWWLWHKKGSSR